MILNQSSSSNVGYHLYSNNVVPAATDVLATYTECSSVGYSPIYLTGATWTVATVSSVANAVYAQQTFTMTGGATVYGYYVTSNDNTQLLWAERFAAAPIILPNTSGIITVTPSINLTFN